LNEAAAADESDHQPHLVARRREPANVWSRIVFLQLLQRYVHGVMCADSCGYRPVLIMRHVRCSAVGRPRCSKLSGLGQLSVAKTAIAVTLLGDLTAMKRSDYLRAALPTIALAAASLRAQQPPQNPDPGFRFRTGVELINVTASVSDANGRFVPGLQSEDFIVYEDGQVQPVTHFSAERVPVSLGIALDTSGSMAGERIRAAQDALDRFLYELLAPDDEIFLYRFSDRPDLVQGWTTDRERLRGALGRIRTAGTTAMYDAVADAVRLAATGQHQKKALVLLSDGNDTSSNTNRRQVQRLIRESEALVYAIGIECGSDRGRSSFDPQLQRRGPIPRPFPFPPGGRRWPVPRQPPPMMPPPQGRSWNQGCSEAVDRGALRDMTDDSGGRTEIVRDPQDLDRATAGIADELSKQYYLGYLSTGKKDGRWHSIRVEPRNRSYRVRARRGYVAS
jgi:Ca-activated chloride channel family protein